MTTPSDIEAWLRQLTEGGRDLLNIDWERSEQEYWAEHGSPEMLDRRLIDEGKKHDRMSMGFWERMFDYLLDFLFPRYYRRVWGWHIERPWMRMIPRDHPKSEK